MSIKFNLVSTKTKTSSIVAIVRHKNKCYKKCIGDVIEISRWNSSRQIVKVDKNDRSGLRANQRIIDIKKAADSVLLKMECGSLEIVDNKHFWQIVDREINGLTYEKTTHERLFIADYILKIVIPRITPNKSEIITWRFRDLTDKIRALESIIGKRYTFDNIDISFYRDLEKYMYDKNYSINYFGLIIKRIKQVMKEAQIVDRLHSNQIYTSAEFKAKSLEVDTVYLSALELEAIYNLAIDEEFAKNNLQCVVSGKYDSVIKSYNVVKNRFLIGAFTGLRVSDFNNLRKEDIVDGKIKIITQKTKQSIVIPLHRIVREILNNGFDLSLSLSEQKTCTYIKTICKHAGITNQVNVKESFKGKVVVKTYEKYELIGTHTARRSFATNAYLAGVPTIAIMKITGHKRESTFMKYIRITSEENATILENHEFFR